MSILNTPTNTLWRTPAVRHLAWLCSAPPLIRMGPVRPPLPAAAVWSRLAHLDRAPQPLLEWLAARPGTRLGHYFESLYSYYLQRILHWPLLLANTPIRDHGGRTLGELDFLVRNPQTGRLEHHEVAVKFYLGLHSADGSWWYGPNARDRLDLKAHHMTGHQCRMTERPETRATLLYHGIDEPVTPVLIMPGYLFRPLDGPEPDYPHWVNPAHEQGGWCRYSRLAERHSNHWVRLHKPHWLGPFQCARLPDTEPEAGTPGADHAALFAVMAARADGRGYQEQRRIFVVPDHWPGR